MTTETILTDDLSLIEQLREYAANNGYSHNDYADTMTLAANALERAIEQAILQSDRIRTIQGMADCMHMVRQEFIEADLIDVTTPPTMIADLVRAQIWALRKDADRWRAWRKANVEGDNDFMDRYLSHGDVDEEFSEEFMDSCVDAAMEQQT